MPKRAKIEDSADKNANVNRKRSKLSGGAERSIEDKKDIPAPVVKKTVKSSQEDVKTDTKSEAASKWLLKSEPDEYSIEKLQGRPEMTGFWDGIRNFRARNNVLRMKVGDECFFYHSSCKVPSIVGIVQVVKEAEPDPTAFDTSHELFDPKSDPSNPRWFGCTIKFVRMLKRPVSLHEVKSYREGALKDLELIRVPRLSVQNVPRQAWDFILGLEDQPAEG